MNAVDPRAINRNAMWFRRLPVEERMHLSYEVVTSGCWHWLGSIRKRGYGQVKWRGRPQLAHRAMYELMVGDIPAGLTLDHLCGNTICVNPAHLEPVTAVENHRRWVVARTACLRGHPYNTENTYVTSGGRRHCRVCRRLARSLVVAAAPLRGRYHPSHCPKGHEYTTENTYVTRTGCRMCRACGRLRMRAVRSGRRIADGRYVVDMDERGAA